MRKQKLYKILIIKQKNTKETKGKHIYFPIQNLENIFSSKSSVDTAPVISPR